MLLSCRPVLFKCYPGLFSRCPGLFSCCRRLLSYRPGLFNYRPGLFSCCPGLFSCCRGLLSCRPGLLTCRPGLFSCCSGLFVSHPHDRMRAGRAGEQPLMAAKQPWTADEQPCMATDLSLILHSYACKLCDFFHSLCCLFQVSNNIMPVLGWMFCAFQFELNILCSTFVIEKFCIFWIQLVHWFSSTVLYVMCFQK